MADSVQGWWEFCETNSKLVAILPTYEEWCRGDYSVTAAEVADVSTIEYVSTAKKVTYKFGGETKTCILITPVDKSTLSDFEILVAESEESFRKSVEDLHQQYSRDARNLFMKPATLWYRWARDAKTDSHFWEFNHLEDGHCENDMPTPKDPIHNQTWKGGKWSKSHVHLDSQNVVRHTT